MSTYYKYDPAERGLAINWADVASGISKKLTDEATRREELKSKIDADTRSLEKVLNENVQGQSERASEFSLDFANQASEIMLLQQRLLKSGQLNIRDYTVQRQNLLDSTNEVFEVSQQFQDDYERRMERAKGSDKFGTSAQFEQYLMDTIGSFADLNQSAAVVNPEDGNVSLGLKVKNPQTGLVTINQDPNNLRAVSSLRQNLMQDYDMYDIDPVTDKFIARTGNWDTVIRETGSRTMKGLLQKITSQTKKSYTVEELMDMQPGLTREEAQEFLDAGLNPYLESENDLVSEILSNSFNAASILTDTKGGYKFTRDKKAADGNDKLIYVEDGPNGVLIPSLSEEQKKVADLTIRNNIRNKENRKVSTTVVSDYTAPTYAPKYIYDQGEKELKASDIALLWMDIGYGDTEIQRAAKAAILGSNFATEKGLIDIDIKTKDAVTTMEFIYDNGARSTPKEFKNRVGGPNEWALYINEILGLSDLDPIRRAAGVVRRDEFTSPNFVGAYSGRVGSGSVTDAVGQVASMIDADANINDDLFFDQDDEDVLPTIQSIVAPFGYTVINDRNDANSLVITNPETGASIRVLTNEGRSGAAQQFNNFKAFLKAQLTTAGAEGYLRVNPRQTEATQTGTPPSNAPGGGSNRLPQ